MNQRVNQEWNPFEVEGARSIIDRLNNYYNNDGTSLDKDKKLDIVANLRAWFPRKTMQQVTNLYDDLVVEMHMLQCPEKEYNGTNSDHGVIYTVDGLVNKNFGLEEEVAMEGMGILFGHPLESMQTMKIQEEVLMVEENKVVLENKMCIHQPVHAPCAKGYWTLEEHRLFLHGLSVCGRGKWKDISKYFVTSRTPAQISSHAQKYFMRLQSKGSGSQRYSINDVELDDADPWKMENSFNFWQALTLQSTIGVDNQNLSFDLQTPLSPFVTMNNIV